MDTAFLVSADEDRSRVLVRTTLRDKSMSLGKKELGLVPLVTFVELLETYL